MMWIAILWAIAAAMASVIALARAYRRVPDIKEDARALGMSVSVAGALIQQAADLGLVTIYPNRLQAIDGYFYDVMREESSGISIVGSTIFGLRGSQRITVRDILQLLSSKAADPAFRLRILLTHPDHISDRQDQEANSKPLARFVISRELLEAAAMLAEYGLQPYVRLYKGSPTCFTIVCEGQRLMLVNPYPYEREGFSSWTAVFQATDGIYEDFVTGHVDQPWTSKRLTAPMATTQDAIKARYEQDIRQATQGISGPNGS